MLSTLGVSRSFSRPRVSDDNPHSESFFKHFKSGPHFPDRFACSTNWYLKVDYSGIEDWCVTYGHDYQAPK
jgi:transposase InsO family protein